MKKYKLKENLQGGCLTCEECEFEKIGEFNNCVDLMTLKNAGVDLSPILEEIKPEPIKYDPAWKPKQFKTYYLVDGGGSVSKSTWYNDTIDRKRFALGMVYPTKELAEESLFRKQLERKMYLELKPWECNWEDTSEKKWVIEFSYYYGYSLLNDHKEKQLGAVYTKDPRVALYFNKDNKEDLIRYFKNELRLP